MIRATFLRIGQYPYIWAAICTIGVIITLVVPAHEIPWSAAIPMSLLTGQIAYLAWGKDKNQDARIRLLETERDRLLNHHELMINAALRSQNGKSDVGTDN